MINKSKIRKSIVSTKRAMANMSEIDKLMALKQIETKKMLLKISEFNMLPTLGKLRLILENDAKNEAKKINGKQIPSENDLKRLALKQAVYEYYMNLPYSPDTVAVDYEGDLTARRDNKEEDETDVDLAPNKNAIYSIWMEKLSKLIRENKLSKEEFDEAADRGIPQGGAFEKQLDRYRKEFMNDLWQDYYENYINK